MAGTLELKVKDASFIIEPAPFEETQMSRPEIGKPTEGPHRYTIYVPHDEKARISIGAAHPLKGENGVAIETRSHVHLWTHDQDAEGVASYLHLGKRAATTGYEVNRGGDGYALYTSGGSSHVALKTVSLISQEDSVFVGAMGNMQLTTHDGSIFLSAKERITGQATGSIELSAGVEEEIEFSSMDTVLGIGLVALEGLDFIAPLGNHGGHATETAAENAETANKMVSIYTGMVETNAAKWKEKFVAAHAKTAAKVLKHAEAMSSIILGFKKTMKKTKKKESGWVEDGTAWLGYGVDAVTKLLAAANYFVPEAYEAVASQVPGYEKKEKKEEGMIKLKATEGISLSADKCVSLYAAEDVSLTGFMSNSMTGLGCSMKAYKDVSIWGGMGAAMKSLAGDVAMTTDFGEANVKGHAGVEISSAEGDVKVTAEKHVQLNSIKDKVQIHGKAGMMFAAGASAGHGAVTTEAVLTLGTMKDVNDFEKAAIDQDHAVLKLAKPAVILRNGNDNKLIFQKSGTKLEVSKLDVKSSGTIKINGSTVNIN